MLFRSILWRWDGATAECYGPYLFKPGLFTPDENNLDNELLEYCLRDVAKSSALSLINRYRGGKLPRGFFDELGSYSEYNDDNSSSVQTVFFRQLSEDPGATVWASPLLDDFLVQEYRRLVLPREIEFVKEEDIPDAHSVLTADLNREENAATLRLLWPGRDLEQNVADHIQLFEIGRASGRERGLRLG